jgi:hypothetical protein
MTRSGPTAAHVTANRRSKSGYGVVEISKRAELLSSPPSGGRRALLETAVGLE